MEDSLQIDSLKYIIDSLSLAKEMYHDTKPIQYINWSPWVLLVATLSLIAAVIIPFIQKILEQKKTKNGFQFYLKKQLGNVFNLMTSEKIEYHEPSVKNKIEKELLDLKTACKKVLQDYESHKSAVQPKIIFMMLMNIQSLFHFSYKLRHTVGRVNFDKITDKTLDNGNNLSDKELEKIYAVLLTLEGYLSISAFHDRFGNLKSIKRDIKDKIWVGLKLEGDFLGKQEVLNEDLAYLNDNENSLKEVVGILELVNKETIKYFELKEKNTIAYRAGNGESS